MPSSDLAFALELADLADSRSLPRFRALDLRIETKPDLTPVTDADRVVERALRERIVVNRPSEGVIAEEEGNDGGAVRWVIDPIDGTKNFSRGVPIWATLIALEREDNVVCGVISAISGSTRSSPKGRSTQPSMRGLLPGITRRLCRSWRRRGDVRAHSTVAHLARRSNLSPRMGCCTTS